MERPEKIKRFIKKAPIETNPEKDKEILGALLRASDNAKDTTSAARNSAWRLIMESKMTKFAAAAIFIVLALFWFALNDSDEPQRQQSDGLVAAAVSKTPAQLVSAISLNMVFRYGDMKAVEKQFEQAEKKVRPTLRESIAIDRLISEMEECEKI